jgi:hypothetical protein
MDAVAIRLTAEVAHEPSTSWWRVSALDVDRFHVYLSGHRDLTKALDNVTALVTTQYAPRPTDIVGNISAVEF